jgi:uncharacterized protein YjgD (DUF1641 family)
METLKMQEQIDQLNRKMDLMLDYISLQRSRAETMDDLLADGSIIVKDFYHSSVKTLDEQAVEINPDEVQALIIKLIKNIRNFNSMIDMLESMIDLAKDAGPVVNEVIIDVTRKFHQFEQKGYFRFFNELCKMADSIIINYNAEDLKKLTENIPLLMDTLKNLGRQEVLNPVNKTINAFVKSSNEEVKKVSVWKFMQQMNSPEMKKTLGFLLNLVKNINQH